MRAYLDRTGRTLMVMDAVLPVCGITQSSKERIAEVLGRYGAKP